MNIIGKEYLNLATKEKVKIVDVYKNIAITESRDRINTNELMNRSLYLPTEIPKEVIRSVSNEDIVDPNNFFTKSYDALADQIKSIPLDQLPLENEELDISIPPSSSSPGYQPSMNESAVIITSPEDEIEEIKRKYGVTSVDDSVNRQKEYFSQFTDDDQSNVQISNPIIESSIDNINNNPISYDPPRDSVDPVAIMFKNIRRTLDFNIDLKIEGKIPRLDFIEMMEDSYEVSLIDYLSNELANNILQNPSIIKDKISSKIRDMIKNGKSPSKSKSSDEKSSSRKNSIRKKTFKNNDAGDLPEKGS